MGGTLLNQWKEIAWYGIRFKIPGDWQLGQIGIRYLLIEDPSGPAMEIKWTPVKGKFSHRTHLKRLASLQNKQVRKSVRPEPPSAEWQAALSDFEASEFSWDSQSTRGRGVILFCPTCRNASLIQFFYKNSSPNTSITSNVLNSFRDHRSDDQIQWSAYDIRALVPKAFELKHHRFEAGRYELDFTDRGRHIILYRWAPASILLSKQNLVQFARSVANFSKMEPVAGKMNGCDTVEWSASPVSDWGRWLSRLSGKASYYWMGIWHLEAKNRILGVRAEDRKPLDPELLDRICSHYESI
jgi:hypothetical protein